MSDLKPCKCGSRIFRRTTKMAGVWLEWLEVGKETESTTDNLKCLRTPKTITCERCGKRSPNPEYLTPTEEKTEK